MITAVEKAWLERLHVRYPLTCSKLKKETSSPTAREVATNPHTQRERHTDTQTHTREQAKKKKQEASIKAKAWRHAALAGGQTALRPPCKTDCGTCANTPHNANNKK